tara:strand:+ start:627 stop:791 length:165 start_codon:yes stop_codon:yes gene_type:complete
MDHGTNPNPNPNPHPNPNPKQEHMFGVIEVAAPTAEALEACRLAIEQIVGFAVR